MPNFSLGLTALRASQYSIDVTANNIANANTEGYHRRIVHQAELDPVRIGPFLVGSGVTVNYVERIRDRVTEASLTNVTSDVANVDQLLVIQRQIEASLLNGGVSISSELDQLFAEVTKFTSAPDEPAQRGAVIEAGHRTASVIRDAWTRIDELEQGVRFQLQQEVDALNVKMEQLQSVTTEIQKLSSQGIEPNTELDKRDTLLNEIADLIGISRSDHFSAELNLTIGNNAIQQGNDATEFRLVEAEGGQLSVYMGNSPKPIEINSGRIPALLDSYNSIVPEYKDKLDFIATELMRKIDSVHAKGIGTYGGFQHLVGTRPIGQINQPLETASPTFPIQAGELTLSITDASGVRRSEVIAIDPAVDSIVDIAAQITAIAGINATVNPETNQLQISTGLGATFDFTGRLESQPDLTGFTGTSAPTLSGDYLGDVNTDWRFEIEGSGDVGISNNLYVNVYSDTGFLLNRHNIGLGYEAGSELELPDGVNIRFSNGSVVDTEQFTTRLTADADTTGILAALGLNSFFSGISASSIAVDEKIVEDPTRFASGKTGDPADTDNLIDFTELEEYRGLPGDLTFVEYFNETNSEIGFQIETNASLSASLNSLKARLEQDRDSYSGVDLNEEIVYLQQFQKSYEAAVRIIQATDDMLNELFQIIR